MKKITISIVLAAILLSSCFSAKISVVSKGNIPQNPKVLILGNELNPYGRPRGHGMAEVYFDIKPNKQAKEVQKIAGLRLPEQNEILR